jgi:hypothetical protein
MRAIGGEGLAMTHLMHAGRFVGSATARNGDAMCCPHWSAKHSHGVSEWHNPRCSVLCNAC